MNVAFLGADGCRLELIEPIGPDSSVARFIERRGAGLHHIAFRVEDIAAVLADLTARGIELIDSEPRPGAHGRLIAFIHPRSCSGVLIELVQGAPQPQP